MSKTMSKVVIDDPEHFRECIKLARERKDTSLINAIQRKRRWDRWADIELRLYRDWAKFSFYFVMWNIKENRQELNGGIIFHGKHDNGGDGGAPTFSVNLTPVDGWSSHT